MLLDRNELSKIGVQFGTLTCFKCPLMEEYIYSYSCSSRMPRKKRCIFNLEKIVSCCYKAQDYVAKLAQQNKKILFISTRKKVQEIVKEQAKLCNMPFMTHKWVRGFLTNFDEIKKNIKRLQNLSSYLQKEHFKTLSKKQQKSIERDERKLRMVYEGVLNMPQLPDAIFIVGLKKKKESICHEAADILGVPIIALCNSDFNPVGVDYVIPGNDENVKSVLFFSSWIANSILNNRVDININTNSDSLN